MMKLAYRICKGCGVRYLQADFLPHRVAGYCTEECWHHEPRGKPTPEDIGWRTGIAAASQRRQLKPISPVIAQSGRWTFDMVRYPHPTGWQIENWRTIPDQYARTQGNKITGKVTCKTRFAQTNCAAHYALKE